MIGQSFGRFRIVSKLGEGGMGSVWRAEDSYLGRQVALKLLPDATSDSPAARRRFVSEARATSRLDHPGIATLYDAGEEGGRLWLAVRLVEGMSLHDRVRGGALEPAEARRIAIEAADALGHAHERGILHRDVTSRNLMLDAGGRAVLIDFGLARLLESSGVTTTEKTMGTISYLAPELLKGDHATEQSDLYGLGVVCYEMLAGRVPFDAERAEASLHGALHERPEPIAAFRDDVDPRFERLVLDCLAKKPADRPRSAAHLAAALRELADRPDSEPAQAPKPRRPRSSVRRTAVAVLPFRTRGDGGEGVAFAAGLAESVAAALGRHPEVQVSWNPDAADDESGVRAAASRGARFALLGTVQRQGERVRVAFSTFDLKRQLRASGDLVDGTIDDPFGLEDELVRAVGRALGLDARPRSRAHGGVADARAHELFLQALGHLQRTDNEASVDGAIGLLEQVVENDGGTAVVHAALGRAYLRKSELSLEPSWHRRAENACRRALELDPHAPEVRVTLGRLELQSGRSTEAVATLKSALELRPESAEAWHALSLAYESVGAFDQAMAAAREAVRLRPDSLRGFDQVGLLSYRTGRFADAVEAWSRAVEIAPDNARVLAALGGALVRLERLAEARDVYARSLRAMPLGIAYIGLGVTDFLAGDLAASLGSFERAVAMMPNDPRTWGNLADTQRWIPGREHESIASFERAIRLVRSQISLNPSDVRNLSYLALWLAKVGRKDEARETIERSLALAPNHLDAHVRAISVYAIAGEFERAADHFEIAVDQGCGLLELEKDPELDALRRQPRVASLVERLRRPGKAPERRTA